MTIALEPRHAIRRRNERAALKLLLTRGELAAALALAAACIYFTIAAPAFATATNVRGVMTDISIVLLVALGQNLVILAGEIDVSVGSILALSAVSAGFVAQELRRLFGRDRGAVRARLGHCVVGVGRRQHAREERQLRT